jgi:hypothetical protein
MKASASYKNGSAHARALRALDLIADDSAALEIVANVVDELATRSSKPPSWMVDELKCAPELLGVVAGIVRKVRGGSRASSANNGRSRRETRAQLKRGAA